MDRHGHLGRDGCRMQTRCAPHHNLVVFVFRGPVQPASETIGPEASAQPHIVH